MDIDLEDFDFGNYNWTFYNSEEFIQLTTNDLLLELPNLDIMEETFINLKDVDNLILSSDNKILAWKQN